jgi:pyruvate,orthophosphate dikinase
MNNIPDSLGTAVNVQSMVFGNFGDDSGSGVAFTRNPSTGERTSSSARSCSTPRARTWSRGSAPRNRWNALAERLPEVYDELDRTQALLEKHYRDMQDIEFTVQEGRFYMLQTRSGKRTGRAAVRIAVEMVAEGMIERAGSAAAGVRRSTCSPSCTPWSTRTAEREVVATGLPASPGGVTGIAVFSADEAVEQEATGKRVILLRRETTPEDIHGMKVAEGVLTELGGMTSHAAVVARGMGVCAITGCDALRIDTAAGTATAEDGTVIRRGDVVTLDGATGEVMLGDVPKIEASTSGDFQTLLGWADKYRRLKVRANAETPEDAAKARELGAEGIGLCRTEHMFFAAERIDHMRAMILAASDEERARAAGDSAAVPAAATCWSCSARWTACR